MTGRKTRHDQAAPCLDQLLGKLARIVTERVDSGHSTGIAAGLRLTSCRSSACLSDNIRRVLRAVPEDLIMSDIDPSAGRGTGRSGRRAKRFLSPSAKYEIWLQLVRQEVTIAEAAAQQQVDRSTIMRIRTVAKEGALAALAASKPGVAAPRSAGSTRSGLARPALRSSGQRRRRTGAPFIW